MLKKMSAIQDLLECIAFKVVGQSHPFDHILFVTDQLLQ